MTDKNLSEPAFPVECDWSSGQMRGAQTANSGGWALGLSMRDYFACRAMEARLMAAWQNPGPTLTAFKESKNNQPPDSDEIDFGAWIAKVSYDQADYMLAARAATGATGETQA